MDTEYESLKKVFDSLDIGFTLLRREIAGDNDSFVGVYSNPVSASIVGYDANEHIGERSIDIHPKLKEDGLLDIFGTALDQGKAIDLGEITYGDNLIEEAVYRVRVIPCAEDTAALLITNVTESKRSREVIEAQNRAILAMSTPTIELWQEILLLPLVGSIDTERAVQMIEHLLAAIVDHEARVAIFDVTGVPTIDTQVAQYLMQAVSAAKMLGTEVLLTGISAEMAMTLTKLGIDISTIRTHRSLRRGISAAFDLLDLEIVSRKS